MSSAAAPKSAYSTAGTVPDRRSAVGNYGTQPMSRWPVEKDVCFSCGQKGHWASHCPEKSRRKPQASSPLAVASAGGSSLPDMECYCPAGLCLVLISNSVKNPDRKFYRCPNQGNQGCGFFKWCDLVISECSPEILGISHPSCPCGAGKCRIIIGKDEKYFACPVKKGQGACNFKKLLVPAKSSDALEVEEMNDSISLCFSQHSEQRTFFSGSSEVSGAREPLKEEEDYMDDILLSTARHFANKFLEHVKGLSVSSFLRQRDQLIKSIQWVTAFGVDCSAFVSQVDDLIQLIDDFNVFSVLVEWEDTIQQLENQLSHVGSEDAARRAKLLEMIRQVEQEKEDILGALQVGCYSQEDLLVHIKSSLGNLKPWN